MPHKVWLRKDILRFLDALEWEDSAGFYAEQRTLWSQPLPLPRQLVPTGVAFSVAISMLADLSLLAILSIRDDKKHNRTATACVTLISHLAADASAILRLCLSGFDVQARSILRGFVEKSDLVLAILNDNNLAVEYTDSSTFEGSRDFFYRRISKGKLAKLARRSFDTRFPAHPLSEWIWGDWRMSIDLMVNAAVHPNHTISMITLFPNIGRSGRSEAIGLWGHPTNNSIRTLQEAMVCLLPLALFQIDSDIFSADGKSGEAMSDESEVTQQKAKRAAQFTLAYCMANSIHLHRQRDSKLGK